MTLVFKDRIKETSVSVGIGNFVLSGPVIGFQSFGGQADFLVPGNTFYYVIDNSASSEWEVGTGHLLSSTTIVRDSVLASSNAGNFVNFSAGTKTVFNTAPSNWYNAPVGDISLSSATSTDSTTHTLAQWMQGGPRSLSYGGDASLGNVTATAGPTKTLAVWQATGPVDASNTNVASTPGGSKALSEWQRINYLTAITTRNIVRDDGADNTGTAEFINAINNAISVVSASGGGIVYMPAGTYKHNNDTGSIIPKTNVVLMGAGMGVTTINFDDSLSVRQDCFSYVGSISNFTMKDFTVHGIWDTAPSTNKSHIAEIHNVTTMVVDSVEFYGARFMSLVLQDCSDVTVQNCRITRSAQDGIRVVSTPRVLITNNILHHVGDNGIACHTPDAATNPARSMITIKGNILEDCRGIVAGGGKSVIISENQLFRNIGVCISVNVGIPAYATEGNTIVHGVQITDNLVYDFILNDTFVAPTQTNSAIIVSSVFWSSGGLAYVPGNNYPASGTVPPPYGYYYQNDQDSGLYPTPSGRGWNISGNQLIRTLNSGSAYSAWGFGQLFKSSGFSDPVTTEAGMQATGISVSGPVRNCLISNNTIESGYIGIILNTQLTGVASDNTFLGVNILGNIISYAIAHGLLYNTTGTVSDQITILNNLFDCDPWHIAPNRTANGTWANPNSCRGMSLGGVKGATVVGNTFKNCATPISGGSTSTINGNYVICNPVSVGFNVNNKGVGDPGTPGRAFYPIITDCDPASASFGALINVPLISTNGGMPSSGTYVAGHFVQNGAATVLGSGGYATVNQKYVVLGWYRITTGSSHVLNTDWVECRTLTGQ